MPRWCRLSTPLTSPRCLAISTSPSCLSAFFSISSRPRFTGNASPCDQIREIRVIRGSILPAAIEPSGEIAWSHRFAAFGADEVGVHGVAAGLVLQGQRGAVFVGHPAVAPAKHGDDHRVELEALLGEAVFVARRLVLVADLLEDAGGN